MVQNLVAHIGGLQSIDTIALGAQAINMDDENLVLECLVVVTGVRPHCHYRENQED